MSTLTLTLYKAIYITYLIYIYIVRVTLAIINSLTKLCLIGFLPSFYRDPHEHLIPPANFIKGNGFSNLHVKALLKAPFQVPVRFHFDSI